jgi:hypothetical protein
MPLLGIIGLACGPIIALLFVWALCEAGCLGDEAMEHAIRQARSRDACKPPRASERVSPPRVRLKAVDIPRGFRLHTHGIESDGAFDWRREMELGETDVYGEGES